MEDNDYMRILVLNGPNLQLLGKLNPDEEGEVALSAINKSLQFKRKDFESQYARVVIELNFRQSNHEGVLIDWVGEAINEQNNYDGIIINPSSLCGSRALAQALGAISDQVPYIEVHLSPSAERQSLTAKASFFGADENERGEGKPVEGQKQYDATVYEVAFTHLFKELLGRRAAERVETADQGTPIRLAKSS